jgi:hypothetical protein
MANPKSGGGPFAKSRWFTRGWTLQELIAPCDLRFYASNWSFLGNKIDFSSTISEITAIDADVLVGGKEPEAVSIARRMSWASRRQTTRVEDIACCLMGIFEVNMPMLYGEGEKALIRLQEEVLKDADDHSLFAWRETGSLTDDKGPSMSSRRLLASSPAEFASSRNIVPFRDHVYDTAYSQTNKGLQIQLPLVLWDNTEDIYLAGLDCREAKDSNNNGLDHRCWIFLKRLSPTSTEFTRVELGTIKTVQPTFESGKEKRRMVRVRQKLSMSTSYDTERMYAFLIQTLPLGYTVSTVYPCDRWNPQNMTLQLLTPSMRRAVALAIEKREGSDTSELKPTYGALICEKEGSRSFVVYLGFKFRGMGSYNRTNLARDWVEIRHCSSGSNPQVLHTAYNPPRDTASVHFMDGPRSVFTCKEDVQGQPMFVVQIKKFTTGRCRLLGGSQPHKFLLRVIETNK